jgi:cytochrome c556
MNHQSKRAQTTIKAAAALLWLIVVASAVYTQTARAQERYLSLPKLMKEGVHEQFTFISFTIFHNAPLDADKLQHLAKTASRLNHLAKQIPGFKSDYLGSLAEQEGAALESAAEDLSKAAETLSTAASRGSEDQFELLFEKLETACNNCHAKFRKELAIESR